MDPPPAALTFWLRNVAAATTSTSTDSIAANLNFHVLFIASSPGISSYALLGLLWRVIRIHRLESQLLSHFPFFGVVRIFRLQSSQVEHQVPGLIRLDVVRERRHRGAVQTCHEDSVDVLIGAAALRPRTFRKVIGNDRTAKIIRQGGGRWAIAHALNAVTLPALHLAEDLFTIFDSVGSDLGLRGNLDGSSGLLFLPTR